MPIKPHLIPGSRILIIGDAPTADDDIRGEPYSSRGQLGQQLDRFLHDAGILRTECSVTTVVKRSPPNGKLASLYADKKLTNPGTEARAGALALAAEIALVKPTVILALGNLAFWATTGKLGINKWRGSVIPGAGAAEGYKVVGTFEPSVINRMWEWRPIFKRDLQRARDEATHPGIIRPEWNFIVRPKFYEVQQKVNQLIEYANNKDNSPLKLSVDIETRASLTSCIGLAWSKLDAICIPLMDSKTADKNYWGAEQELWIMMRLQVLLTHRNVRIIGQNFGYDAQYFAVQHGFLPQVHYDTMIMQHVACLGMKKGLDFISSMYSEYYCYWKDDGKHWDPKMPEEQHWTYNCEDCVRTFECYEVLDGILDRSGLQDQYAFLRAVWPHVLRAMLRGVRIDEKKQKEIASELIGFIEQVKQEVTAILGHEINVNSPKQMAKLFYEDLAMRVVKDKKTGNPTCNDDALQVFKKREPILTGLVDRIAMLRTAGVLLSTFALMPLDLDKRMRCYYNVAGTDTLRLNSGENAFGSGGNLQNIPKGDDDKAAAKKLELIAKGERRLVVPNIRTMYVPDYGKTFFDTDLDRADLMVVIWEADDEDLRAAVRDGVDLHTFNASALFGVPESHVNYAQRQAAKMFAHGTNYGGSARTMAINCGFTVHQSEVMQRRWFAAHPGIKEWHRRTEAQLQATRSVTNAFGFRRRYFDRIESVLPEALAWVPQSTVAYVINAAWKNINERIPEVEVLLQVHDSLAGQFPTTRARPVMREMKKCFDDVVIPYPRPLIIGAGISISTKSWGDCEATDWPEPLPAGLPAQTASGIIIATA